MSGIPRPTSAAPAPTADRYVPGTCNIGPWEIRRRRAVAVIALAIGGLLMAVLVAIHAPAPIRLVLIMPLWGGVFSWLQARRGFCGAFAIAGIANFGEGTASRRTVDDPTAHRADVLATWRLTRNSFLLALMISVIAVLLPL